MAHYELELKSVTEKQGKKGPYHNLVFLQADGKTKGFNLFNTELAETLDEGFMYTFDTTMNGEYENLDPKTLKLASQASHDTVSDPSLPTSKRGAPAPTGRPAQSFKDAQDYDAHRRREILAGQTLNIAGNATHLKGDDTDVLWARRVLTRAAILFETALAEKFLEWPDQDGSLPKKQGGDSP